MSGFFNAGSKAAKHAALTTMFVASVAGFTSCDSSAAKGQEEWKQKRYKKTEKIDSSKLSASQQQEIWKQNGGQQQVTAKFTP